MSGAPRTPEEWKRARAEEARLLSDMLRERITALAAVLLPEGRRDGADWRAGARGSKSIRLTGPDRGVYRDFEAGTKGMDPLGTVAALLCNGSLREAVAWSKAYLGYEGLSDNAVARAKAKAEERAAADRAQAKQHDAKRARQARGLWHNAAPLAGSPAETYLRVARGIDIGRLPKPPGALRYSPATWCKTRQGEYPAMVSGLWRQGAAQMVACHRTYLAGHADGRVTKADVEPVRSILGSWPGAVIPLTRGETGRRWRDIEEGELVALGEGIEEGLSVALVKPEWRVGAVGFVGNFGRVILPCWCHVVLCVNNDPPGSPADVAVHGGRLASGRQVPGAVAELEAAGHVVRVAQPPAAFKDWNDFLRGVKRER